MEVRDAVETDAGAIARIADAPADAMRRMVHDRTVSVAVADDTARDPNADTHGDESPELLGFVSYDVRDGTVHVTQLGGTNDACERLLAEPMRFAASEGMPVEVLVVEGDETIREAITSAGFERAGSGPRFAGRLTTRYRTDPS
jgi:hypothetical protein